MTFKVKYNFLQIDCSHNVIILEKIIRFYAKKRYLWKICKHESNHTSE